MSGKMAHQDSSDHLGSGASGQRIAAISLTRCIQRHVDPGWTVRRGTFPEWNGYILHLRTDAGHAGVSYIDSLPEFSDGWEINRAAVEMISPIVLGRDPLAIGPILADIDTRLAGHRFVKSAFDCALHEVVCRILGQPLVVLLGGAVRHSIPSTYFVPIKTPMEMADLAARGVAGGFEHIKLKLRGEFPVDVERVKAVRERLGPTPILSIDPNQGYPSPKEAIRALRRMEDLHVAFAEQPIHCRDFAGMADIRGSTAIDIQADEAAQSLADVYELASEHIVDSINLRLNELGGIRNTIAAMRICEMTQVGYRFSAYGPQITAAQVAHVAASAKGLRYACDVGEYLQLQDDPFTGLHLERGALSVPTEAGSGVSFESGSSPEFCLSAT